MIVVDTNLTAYLFIVSPKTALAENAFRKEPEWCAPLLWRSEFRNILAVYMRRGYLTHQSALQLTHEAELLLGGAEYLLNPRRC